MEGLIAILFIAVVLPLIFVIMGIVKMCSSDEQKRKTGLKFLLGGILLFGVFVVIGFSMCSNMSFGGGH
jgi:NADH:ubiquinone oxidoreductase subunit 6 (subunit J)